MPITHNIVSVSGSKDSTALLLLAIERGAENLQAVFADTGHEHAQTYEYVQYLNDKVFRYALFAPISPLIWHARPISSPPSGASKAFRRSAYYVPSNC